MKKIFLITPILFFLWNCGYAQKSISDDYIIDSVKIEHPLFNKVFPGVEFILYTSEITMPNHKFIKGKYQNKFYFLPQEINKLFSALNEQQRSSIEDRINVCLQFFFWNRLDTLKYIKNLPCDKTEKIIEKRNYSYKVNFRISNELYEIFIQVIDKQIGSIEIYINNNRAYSYRFFLSYIEQKL